MGARKHKYAEFIYVPERPKKDDKMSTVFTIDSLSSKLKRKSSVTFINKNSWLCREVVVSDYRRMIRTISKHIVFTEKYTLNIYIRHKMGATRLRNCTNLVNFLMEKQNLKQGRRRFNPSTGTYYKAKVTNKFSTSLLEREDGYTYIKLEFTHWLPNVHFLSALLLIIENHVSTFNGITFKKGEEELHRKKFITKVISNGNSRHHDRDNDFMFAFFWYLIFNGSIHISTEYYLSKNGDETSGPINFVKNNFWGFFNNLGKFISEFREECRKKIGTSSTYKEFFFGDSVESIKEKEEATW